MDAIVDALIRLGKFVLLFGRTERGTYYENGTTPESDTDHTVMLALVACAFAARKAPHLAIGKIAQFALVHDLVEAYAGDTKTLKHMSPADIREKEERERAAFERICREFADTLPWIPDTIREYESLATPEARFVKTMDKGMPSITHSFNGGVTIREHGYTPETILAQRKQQLAGMRASYAADQPEALTVIQLLMEEAYQAFVEQERGRGKMVR